MINGMVVSEFIAGNFFYVFVGWILVTVYLRRFRRTSLRKRVAVLIQAVSIFLVFIAASAVVEFGGTDAYLLATVVAVGIVLATVLRKRAFPYSRTCPACGATLDFTTILVRDDNLCTKCQATVDEAPGDNGNS